MYLIGIDISKFKHDCFIATEVGKIIKEFFSFENDAYGFSYLLSILKSLDSTQEKRIGIKPTGHYGNNLMRFLHDNNFFFLIEIMYGKIFYSFTLLVYC